jgi:hypothetical protein
MPDTLNAAELRRLAMQCGTRALERDCQAADRDRYLKMQESLLALAESADWLAGKKTAERAGSRVTC